MATRTPKTREALQALLAPLRLDVEVFEHAVEDGASYSRTFSAGAPKSAPENARWVRTVETLHHELMRLQRGWERFDPQNLPYFLHSGIRIGVIVSSGDQNVGVTYASPTTRNPKGAAFAQRVDDNGRVALFGPLDGDEEVEVDVAWVFLYDEREGMVHVELSRPKSMSGSFVDSWDERIIFPPYDIATGHLAFEDAENAEDEDEGDIGFAISRR